MRLSAFLLSILLLSGCAGSDPRTEEEIRDAEVALQHGLIAMNRVTNQRAIEAARRDLAEAFPNASYVDYFNGLNKDAVERLMQDSCVVWANGVPLTEVFPNFMEGKFKKMGFAVQADIIVGTIVVTDAIEAEQN